MPELTKNKATISPQKQLHWFVNKLISIYENPITIILQEYDELTCFPVDILRKEETGLFPLGRNASATEYDSEDQEYASYCIEMLEKIKRDIPKLEDFGLHFNKEGFTWYEDNNNFEGNGYAFYLDCDYKPIFEAYLHFMNGDKTEHETVLQKTKKKQLQLPNLPRDLKWEEIIIKFLNGDEVQITTKNKVWQSNYELMGFKDQKTKNPNLQWKFLKALSLVNGFLNWDNNKNLTTKERNNVRKRKQELSETLEIYFHTIKGNPFFDYKKEDGYRIKIQLIPEQGSDIKDTIKSISNNMGNDNEDVDPDTQDYFSEQISDSNNW
jgi:hypothetical protein